MAFKRTRTVFALSIATMLTACVTGSESPDGWISAMNNRAPTKSNIYVCHAYRCKLKYTFRPNANDLKQLTEILSAGSENPEKERKAIGHAVEWFENRVGPLMGSDKDKGGLDLASSGIPGQMDCIDEASNTTSLLSYASMHGLLKHHKVQSPVARGFFLDGRYPHATAVVKDNESGKKYAVDSWIYDNGVYPAIKPLKVWLAESPAR